MQIKQILRYQLVYILLAVLLVVAVILNINTGNIHISPARIFRIIFLKGDMGTPEYNIIWKIRLPRLCMAAILGGALSLSGFLLQTFFRNPIAGPFVLGISSGAKMFVAITMIFLLKYVSGMPLWAQVAAAFVGSLLAMLYVLIFANKVKSMSMLLVVGIMISYICSAITDLCITFANDSDIANLTHWAMGSFSGSSWPTVKLAAVVVFPTAVITFLFSKPISAYLLGEGYAQSMGINISSSGYVLYCFRASFQLVLQHWRVLYRSLELQFHILQDYHLRQQSRLLQFLQYSYAVRCFVCSVTLLQEQYSHHQSLR